MREVTIKELKILITTLGQCLMAIHADFKNIDCKGDLIKQVIPIIVDKIHKLVEIARSVKKLCTTVKKEDINCLPCFGSSAKSVKD